MKLYSYWRSTAAFRARIALNLKAVEYEICTVNLVDPAAMEQYRQVNSQGLVPALVDGENTIAQSTAIVEYLEEAYPNPPLLPANYAKRATVRGMCQIIACDIHPLNNLRVLNYLKGPLDREQGAVDGWYNHWVVEGFNAFQSLVDMHGGEYCFGDEITMADTFLVPQMFNARRFSCDLAPFKKLCDLSDRLEIHEAFQRAAPNQQPGAN